MVRNLLGFVHRRRRVAVQPPAMKVASLLGLPNELQLMIINMVFIAYAPDFFQYCAGDYYTFLRRLRCSVLGIVGILPHFRAPFLEFLRPVLSTLQPQHLEVDRNARPYGMEQFLEREVSGMKMVIAYLETGDIRKLRNKDEATWTTLPITTRPRDAVLGALKSLQRFRK